MKKILLILFILALPQAAFAGSQTFYSSGTFSVPVYGTLTVTVNGAGGGGASGCMSARLSYYSSPGAAGSASSFNGSVVGGGGGGASASPPGACYTAAAGTPGSVTPGGVNGGGAAGGAGGSGQTASGAYGGNGGSAQKTYVSGELAPGSNISVGIGSGGSGGGTITSNTWIQAPGSSGSNGAVYITWTDPVAPTCSISISPNPASYSYNGTATLTWSATNANTSMYIANVGYVSGSSGSFTVPRTTTTSHTGTAVGAGGTATCPATLTVTAPASPTATITSSIGSTMNVGQSSTITATFTPASGDSLTEANIDSPVGTGLAANTTPGTKTYTFTPTQAGTYTFYARARTSYFTSWTTYKSVTVTVQAPCIQDGVTLQNGESATFYSARTFSSGQTCAANSQTRTCTNGTLTGSASYQYASCTCAALYSCSGNNVTYTNTSCSTSTTATCTAPNYCSPGVSSCVTPPPSFITGANTTGHLQVKPQIVRLNGTAIVYWNVANVSSCTVTGSNGQSWNTKSGTQATSAITQRTTYTLACTGLDGSSVNESAVVNLAPVFRER